MAFRGELLKAWRISRNLSQATAASQIDITQAMWTMLERGKAKPSTDTLVAISRLTGISVDALLGNPTQPLPTQELEQAEQEAIRKLGKLAAEAAGFLSSLGTPEAQAAVTRLLTSLGVC